MDFKKLMSAQIAQNQAQKKPGEAKTSPAPNAKTGSKYLKRSEIEAAREAAYLAEQATLEAERIARADRKRKAQDEEAEKQRHRETKRQRLAEESRKRQLEDDEKLEKERRRRLGLADLPPKDPNEDVAKEDETYQDDEPDVPGEEVISLLRAKSEPVRLFGETDKQRVRRYQRLKNPESYESGDKQLAPKATQGPIPTTLEPVPEIDMKVPSKLPPSTDHAARLHLSCQLASWFTLVLREWAIALGGRSDETKKSFSGQAATNSMIQALSHLKPLFRKLEKAPKNPLELPEDLLMPIVEIVRASQERRYVDANDGYLRLSIGKAAWPIGVTMVGIHERSAREKLHESDNKAHIMADETTRKILQSIKRCLSFAQTRWPPEDMGQLMG